MWSHHAESCGAHLVTATGGLNVGAAAEESTDRGERLGLCESDVTLEVRSLIRSNFRSEAAVTSGAEAGDNSGFIRFGGIIDCEDIGPCAAHSGVAAQRSGVIIDPSSVRLTNQTRGSIRGLGRDGM